MTAATHPSAGLREALADLARNIENTPCTVPEGYPFGSELCAGVYRQGHRDALAAAASKLRTLLSAAPADSTEQALGLYVEQAEAFKELLDKHAPHTTGNLKTRLAQALSAAPAEQPSGWRDIATAPKDGSYVLGCFWNPSLPQHYMPKAVVWATYHPNANGEACWRDAVTCGNKMKNITHWKPLDAPPTAPAEQLSMSMFAIKDKRTALGEADE